jgi:hypothetical protein
MTTTAIIAEYPEPFLHGYNGVVAKTSIIYSQNFFSEAQQIQQTLSNHDVDSSLVSIDDLDETTKTTENIILIGTYSENTLIKEINNDAEEIGLCIIWDGSNITVVDTDGTLQHCFSHAGCIIAMQNHWNPKGNMHGDNVIWMIAGVTPDDVRHACLVLSEHPEQLHHATSALITESEVMRVP